ncbi:MAG: hypothetical protein R2939_18045 [Kofleriaceae bacterium]
MRGWFRSPWRWLLTAATACAGCGADDADLVDGGPGQADGAAQGGLSIALDYRFDDAAFFTPAARTTLAAAAAAWGATFTDDFFEIPAGTSVRTRDPEAPTADGMAFDLDVAIDDLLVFVGCSHIDGPSGVTATSNHSAALGSVVDGALRAQLQARYQGADFEPWTAWISFDCDEAWFFDQTLEDASDIPGDQTDFWSTAMHELAHTLGFGTADAFAALVDGTPAFTGAHAVAAHGGPVPLTAAGTHFASGLSSDGREPLMDSSRPGGERFPPTTLDRAALADLGYQLR